ncbi:hypothetical protein Trydic_g14287 [Trypoxylus dichotomus]
MKRPQPVSVRETDMYKLRGKRNSDPYRFETGESNLLTSKTNRTHYERKRHDPKRSRTGSGGFFCASNDHVKSSPFLRLRYPSPPTLRRMFYSICLLGRSRERFPYDSISVRCRFDKQRRASQRPNSPKMSLSYLTDDPFLPSSSS